MRYTSLYFINIVLFISKVFAWFHTVSQPHLYVKLGFEKYFYFEQPIFDKIIDY